MRRIGEISRDLEKRQGFAAKRDNGDANTKNEVLNKAGISLRSVNRYEELAGPPARSSTFFLTARQGVAGGTALSDQSLGRCKPSGHFGAIAWQVFN